MNPKQHLEYYSRVYPDAWKQTDDFRSARGKDIPFWPEWCFMPLAGAYAIVSAEAESQGMDITKPEFMPLINDVGIIGALAAWRVTQGIYRFDPDVYDEVVNTPLSGDLPHDILFGLPEWCIYVETPGMNIKDMPLYGFFAHLEYDAHDGRKELRFVLDFTPEISDGHALMPEVLHLGPWTINESISRKVDEAARAAQAIKIKNSDVGLLNVAKNALVADTAENITPLLSLLLYICSVNADIQGEGNNKPAKPQPKKTKRGKRLFPPAKVSTWDVGVRMGAALRRVRESDSEKTNTDTIHGERSSPRAHIRRAHWHLFWTGPRSGEQKAIVKWLPPIPVNVDNYDELPVVIRKIKKDE